MTVKKKIRRKRVRQQELANHRDNFHAMCMTWRPVLDYCLSMEGDDVFTKKIPDMILTHMGRLDAAQTEKGQMQAAMGYCVQLVLVAHAHLLNCVDASNPGVKRQLVRELLNSVHMREGELDGLPAGE